MPDEPYAAPKEAAALEATAATEHSEEITSVPADKQLIHSIMNAFLNNMSLHAPQVGQLLLTMLNDDVFLTPLANWHVQRVCS